jgi:hypothetical protein
MFGNGGCRGGGHGTGHGNKFITFIVIMMANIAYFFFWVSYF